MVYAFPMKCGSNDQNVLCGWRQLKRRIPKELYDIPTEKKMIRAETTGKL